jgi:hypothetical protein
MGWIDIIRICFRPSHKGGIKMKEMKEMKEEMAAMGQSLLWIGSIVDEFKIDLRKCTGQELVDSLVMIANQGKPIDREQSLRWVCSVIEETGMDPITHSIQELLDVLFDLKRNAEE